MSLCILQHISCNASFSVLSFLQEQTAALSQRQCPPPRLTLNIVFTFLKPESICASSCQRSLVTAVCREVGRRQGNRFIRSVITVTSVLDNGCYGDRLTFSVLRDDVMQVMGVRIMPLHNSDVSNSRLDSQWHIENKMVRDVIAVCSTYFYV